MQILNLFILQTLTCQTTQIVNFSRRTLTIVNSPGLTPCAGKVQGRPQSKTKCKLENNRIFLCKSSEALRYQQFSPLDQTSALHGSRTRNCTRTGTRTYPHPFRVTLILLCSDVTENLFSPKTLAENLLQESGRF